MTDADDTPPPDASRAIGRLIGNLRETARAAPAAAAVCVALCLISAATPFTLGWSLGRLVDLLLAAPGQASALHLMTFAVAAAFVMGQVADVARQALGRRLGHEMTGAVQRRVMRALNRATSLAALESPETQRLREGVRRVEGVDIVVGDAVPAIMSKLVTLGGSMVAALMLSRWTGAWALVAWLALLACYGVTARSFVRGVTTSRDTTGVWARSAYLRDLLVEAGSAKEVRLFGLQDLLADGHAQATQEASAQLQARRSGNGLQRYGAPAVVGVVYAAVLGWIALGVAQGAWPPGALAAAGVALRGLHGLLSWDHSDLALVWSTAALGNLDALERRLPGAVAKTPAPSLLRSMTCRGLIFAYPGASEPVLRSLDLDIAQGASLAIVGLNGAGKSTLARLLSGLDTPDAGRIEIDGAPLAGAARIAWQRRCAVVLQDFVRYDATVAENIALGAPEHQGDQAGVREVAAACGLTEAIERLPARWETKLAPRAHGPSLSGGQWQRLAVARALFAVRHGAELLILDEPAASLDLRGEAQLNAAVLAMAGRCATVLVSHRMATVRSADRIAVLEDGRIVELGDHRELLAANGRYAELHRLQARAIGMAP